MNLFFIIILFAKILILEFIGLHPYVCRVGSQVQESAYMKLPRDGQIIGFILVHKSQLDVSQEGGGGGEGGGGLRGTSK